MTRLALVLLFALAVPAAAGRAARTFVVHPTARATIVDLDAPDPAPLTIEIGGWMFRDVLVRRTVPPVHAAVHAVFPGLPAGADLFVRVRRGPSDAVIEDYRFRTPAPALPKPDVTPGYLAIAAEVRRSRDPALALALWQQIRQIADPVQRAAVHEAAVWARVPDACAAALDATRDPTATTSPPLLTPETIGRAAELIGGAPACDTLAAAVERAPTDAALAPWIARADPDRAHAIAERWLSPSTALPLRAAAAALLAELPDEPSIALLERELKGPAVAAAAEALSAMDTPRARMALTRALMQDAQNRALLRAAGHGADRVAVPPLAQTLSLAHDPELRREAALALAALGGPPTAPPLRAALSDADPAVAEAAAFGCTRASSPPDAATFTLRVPAFATYAHTGLKLSPGQSCEVSSTGAPILVHLGTSVTPVSRDPVRVVSPTAAELILSPGQSSPGIAQVFVTR